MSTPRWTEVWRDRDVVLLHAEDNDDGSLYVPAQSIACWRVDWNPEGGMIELSIVGHGTERVIFEEGDMGQACADAVETIVAAHKAATEQGATA